MAPEAVPHPPWTRHENAWPGGTPRPSRASRGRPPAAGTVARTTAIPHYHDPPHHLPGSTASTARSVTPRPPAPSLSLTTTTPLTEWPVRIAAGQASPLSDPD